MLFKCVCVVFVFCVMLYGLLLLWFDAFMSFFVCFVVLVVRVRCDCLLFLCDVARAVFVFVVLVCL